jgi:hypothetical protein
MLACLPGFEIAQPSLFPQVFDAIPEGDDDSQYAGDTGKDMEQGSHDLTHVCSIGRPFDELRIWEASSE